MMTSRILRLSGIAALIALGVGACNSDTLTDINQDPNNPTSAPPGPVFTNAARLAMGRWLGGGAMDLRGPEFTVQHLAEVQYPDEDAYRRLGPGDTDGDFIRAYTQDLKNLQAVVDVGKSENEPLLWGPAQVLRSLVFSYVTDVWGDVPYSEALRGDSGAIAPKYDAQKDIYTGLFADLDEATTAMAFADLAARGVDVAVIEVGLGGRLDSTNVITPLVSVVTKIAREHTDYLGNDLASIAREKAGIARSEERRVGKECRSRWSPYH